MPLEELLNPVSDVFFPGMIFSETVNETAPPKSNERVANKPPCTSTATCDAAEPSCTSNESLGFFFFHHFT